MGSRFGRNKKRKLTEEFNALLKDQRSQNEQLRVVNRNLNNRVEKAEEFTNSFVNMSISDPEAFCCCGATCMNTKMLRMRIEIPPFMFSRMINMEDIRHYEAIFLGHLISETKSVVSKALDKELTMHFTKMIREQL